MKEATGELSGTVITIVAIAAIAAIFTAVLLPILKTNITNKTKCAAASYCDPCDGGKMKCYYYDDGDAAGAEQTITCNCDASEAN